MAIDPGPLHENAAEDCLIVRVGQLLANMDARKRTILERRMGIGGHPESLADIAQSFQLTRERIRQLEMEAITELSPLFPWFRELTQDLAHILQTRDRPLTFLGAEEVEPRLQGMARHGALLSFLLQRLDSADLHVVCIRDIAYLLLLGQKDWEVFCNKMLRKFRSDQWAGTVASECKRHVLQQGQGLDRGALELCWQEIVLACGFVAVPQGIVLKPATYAGWVRYVLTHADQPMYLHDIKTRIRHLAGKQLPAKSIHNALTNTAVLFSRGLYGLEHHIRVPPDLIPAIMEAAEQQVMAGPALRQWHASELLAAVVEELGPVPGLTKYVLNYLLRKSRHLHSLNRMVWHHREADAVSPATRINIRDAVVTILEEVGYPLSLHEIHSRLIAQRGLDQDLSFQIHPDDQLVHLASGLWGIRERDDLPALFARAADA